MLSASPPNRNGTNVRPISVQISDCMTAGRFMPPYSSGVDSPQKPNCLRLELQLAQLVAGRGRAGGRRSRRSTSCSSGITSLRMKVARGLADRPLFVAEGKVHCGLSRYVMGRESASPGGVVDQVSNCPYVSSTAVTAACAAKSIILLTHPLLLSTVTERPPGEAWR